MNTTPRIPRRSGPSRESSRRLILAVVMLFATIGLGTLGYIVIERWPFLDALYMTLITITTIGYGEPRPLSVNGRLFTLVLILSTIGIIGYAASTIARFVLEGEFNRVLQGRVMDRRIRQMTDHYILCGCGSTGFYIAETLKRDAKTFVVVERNEARIEDLLERLGEVPFILDDATKDDALREAGIERARGLISAVSDDKDNVFIVLTARSMRPDMRIVSRLIHDENAEKLKRAGADEIVSANAIGGQRMASVMVRPSMVKFLDEITHGPTPLGFDEIPVKEYPALAGQTLAEAHIGRQTGMLVVAIHRDGKETKFNPRGEAVLHEDDVLLVIGTPEQRARLHTLDLH